MQLDGWNIKYFIVYGNSRFYQAKGCKILDIIIFKGRDINDDEPKH